MCANNVGLNHLSSLFMLGWLLTSPKLENEFYHLNDVGRHCLHHKYLDFSQHKTCLCGRIQVDVEIQVCVVISNSG